MAEPVAGKGYSGSQMDARASRSLDQYRRREPSSYSKITDTVSVPEGEFRVGLNAVFSVKCASPVPARHISRFRYVYPDGMGAWQVPPQLIL